MERRTYLTAAASAATIALAGCSALGGGGSGTETVVDDRAHERNKGWRFDAEAGDTLTVTIEDHTSYTPNTMVAPVENGEPTSSFILDADINTGETSVTIPDDGRYWLHVSSEDADVTATLD